MHKYIYINTVVLICLIWFQNNYSADSNPAIEQIPIGNFALPTSQRLSPLFGQGQNIVDKGDLLLYIDFLNFSGYHLSYRNILFSCLYGLTNTSSLYVFLPINIGSKQEQIKTAGLDDILVQFEYAYYNKEYTDAINSFTAFIGLYLPSGSTKLDNLSVSSGPLGFTLGATASHLSVQWYAYLSAATILRTPHIPNDIGNSYFYQSGLGHLIGNKDGWMCCCLLEMNGTYSNRNKILEIPENNTGGNFIFLAPSFYLANEHAILQFGLGIPISQHLFGLQAKTDYIFNGYFSYKF